MDKDCVKVRLRDFIPKRVVQRVELARLFGACMGGDLISFNRPFTSEFEVLTLCGGEKTIVCLQQPVGHQNGFILAESDPGGKVISVLKGGKERYYYVVRIEDVGSTKACLMPISSDFNKILKRKKEEVLRYEVKSLEGVKHEDPY